MILDIHDVIETNIKDLMKRKQAQDDFLSGKEMSARPKQPELSTEERQLTEEDMSLADIESLKTTEAPDGYWLVSESRLNDYGLSASQRGAGGYGLAHTRESAYLLVPKGTWTPMKASDGRPKSKPKDISIKLLRNNDLSTGWLTVYRYRDDNGQSIRVEEEPSHYITFLQATSQP